MQCITTTKILYSINSGIFKYLRFPIIIIGDLTVKKLTKKDFKTPFLLIDYT